VEFVFSKTHAIFSPFARSKKIMTRNGVLRHGNAYHER